MSTLVSVGLVRTAFQPYSQCRDGASHGSPLGRPVITKNELLPERRNQKKARNSKSYLSVDGRHGHHFHVKHSSMVVDPLHTRERNLEWNNRTMKRLLKKINNLLHFYYSLIRFNINVWGKQYRFKMSLILLDFIRKEENLSYIRWQNRVGLRWFFQGNRQTEVSGPKTAILQHWDPLQTETNPIPVQA